MFKGIEKLIETIGNGIGKAYQPLHLLLMTKATEVSLKRLGYDIDKFDGKVKIVDGELSVEVDKSISNLPGEVQYLVGVELKKQENLQIIYENTVNLLKEVEDDKVRDTPVDESWMLNFIDGSSKATDEEIRNMWSKILADEVVNPGSYSIRTLKELERISKSEAEAFIRVANATFRTGPGLVIPANNDVRELLGVQFSDVVLLESIGLLSGTLTLTIDGNKGIMFDKSICVFISKGQKQISIHQLSNIAQELIKLVDFSRPTLSDDFYRKLFTLKKGEELHIHPMIDEKSYNPIFYKTIK